MGMPRALLLFLLPASTLGQAVYKPVKPWRGTSVDDLHRQYHTIFGAHGNRNAASHLWSSFVLERASQMDARTFVELMAGFCAVSGSIVRPSDYNRYRLTLPTADGRMLMRGYMHYCCWPCICDSHDFLKVDFKTVTTADGSSERYTFAVLGDPCAHEEKLDVPFVQPFGYRQTTLRREAPAVECQDGRLKGATFSDNGHVIVAMFFDANFTSEPSSLASPTDSGLTPAGHTPTPGRLTSDGAGHSFHDEVEYGPLCTRRAESGYNSGMGEIFRKVAAITPVGPGMGGRGRQLDDENGVGMSGPGSGDAGSTTGSESGSANPLRPGAQATDPGIASSTAEAEQPSIGGDVLDAARAPEAGEGTGCSEPSLAGKTGTRGADECPPPAAAVAL